MYIESPEYRIPTSTGTLVLTGLNARSNVDEDEITGLDWKDAWIELPDGKLRPIQDKSSIQDDENPTGIANPADYMQKITFEDSDENGKPEKVTVEKGDTEVSDKREKVIDKRVKSMKDGWGKTKVMKDKEKEAREKDVCE